jgi:hypothetical protein
VSGYRSSALRHDCATHGCLQASLPMWDWIISCFPRGIRPTDIDGMVEINGHVLFIEQKRAGATLPSGQRRGLLAMSRKPQVTVLFLRETADTDWFEVLVLADGKGDGFQLRDSQYVRGWLMTWAQMADAVPPVATSESTAVA